MKQVRIHLHPPTDRFETDPWKARIVQAGTAKSIVIEGPGASAAASEAYVRAYHEWDGLQTERNARVVGKLIGRSLRELDLHREGARPMGMVRCYCILKKGGSK